MATKKSTPRDRALRHGGIIFIVAAVQFVVAMLVVQYAYGCAALPSANVLGGTVCYNPGTNPISDLGNTVTSALWPVFNYSIVLFGALMLLGIFLISKAFGNGRVGAVGLAVLAVAVLAGAGVGVVPENTILAVHSIFALISFWGGGIGILLIGLSMAGDRSWKGFAAYSIVSGIFIVLVLLVFMLGGPWATSGSGFGFGGMERLVVAPLLLWIVVIGAKVLRME